MENLKAVWDSIVKFLTDYDAKKIAEVLRKVDWAEVIKEPLTWVIGVPVLIFFVWRKQYRVLLFAASSVLFLLLLQNTLPHSGQSMELPKILEFIGGTIILVGLNLYFLIMRD